MRILIAAWLVSQTAVAQAPYTYSPEHKRDPFANLTSTVPPTTQACERSLCKFALSDLRLVAIVANGSASVAMFEDPQGTGLIARHHAQIGQSGGRISDIARDCVTVTEQIRSGNGRTQPNRVRLCMPAPATIVHELVTDRVIPVP